MEKARGRKSYPKQDKSICGVIINWALRSNPFCPGYYRRVYPPIHPLSHMLGVMQLNASDGDPLSLYNYLSHFCSRFSTKLQSHPFSLQFNFLLHLEFRICQYLIFFLIWWHPLSYLGDIPNSVPFFSLPVWIINTYCYIIFFFYHQCIIYWDTKC